MFSNHSPGRPLPPLLALLLALTACGDSKDTGDTEPVVEPGDSADPCAGDRDCDGVVDEEDCDPDDPYVYPGADEVPYNGKDDDCAGDGDLTDVDGDGYDGVDGGGEDCNDNNPDVFPGADEDCDDVYAGVDRDCDGYPEETTDDCDQDGYGLQEDCNEEDPDINPGAEEIWYDDVDQDCDAQSDYDADGDGEDSDEYSGDDCDDNDPDIYKDNPEVWDGVENNCDGEVDIIDQNAAAVKYLGSSYPDNEGYFGIAAAWTSDFDGDGVPDIIAGASHSGEDDSYAGRFYLLAGAGSDDGTNPYDTYLAMVEGEAGSSGPEAAKAPAGGGSELGRSVASLGDLDGDGYDEVLVGAPAHGDTPMSAGTAFLYTGSTLSGGGELSLEDALTTLTGVSGAGGAVAAIGDVDDDGIPDLAVGGGDDGTAGAAFFSGADAAGGGELDADDALATFSGSGNGSNISGEVDWDGDGIVDVVTASGTSSAGTVYVLSGAELTGGVELAGIDLEGLGTDAMGDGLGFRVGWLDDADEDGYAELLVSAPYAAGAASFGEGGEVYVIPGDVTWEGELASEIASFTVQGTIDTGWLVSGARGGDFDADGLEDLFVSHAAQVPEEGDVTCTAHVFFATDLAEGGTVAATDSTVTFESGYDNDKFGYITAYSDYDEDGDDDILVTGYRANDPSGGLWVFEPMLAE